jgi:hypothetical protein
VLDLAEMRALDLDAERRTAWAQTGLTAGEYTTAAGAHGLATGFGDTASVGIGGLTLGGGVGYLVRKHGLTIDDLLAAEVVTADGQLLRTDAQTHPDLFWAIRGGGSNFGVATRFQFRLHQLDTIVGGMLILPATPGHHQRLCCRGAGRGGGAFDHRQHCGRTTDAAPARRAPRQAGRHGPAGLRRRPRGGRPGHRAVPGAGHPDGRHGPADALPGDLPADRGGPTPGPRGGALDVRRRRRPHVAETIVGYLQAATASLAVAQLRVLGGAMAQVPAEATAFAHRRRRVMVAVGGWISTDTAAWLVTSRG